MTSFTPRLTCFRFVAFLVSLRTFFRSLSSARGLAMGARYATATGVGASAAGRSEGCCSCCCVSFRGVSTSAAALLRFFVFLLLSDITQMLPTVLAQSAGTVRRSSGTKELRKPSEAMLHAENEF